MSRAHVLVIDDEPIVLRMVRRFLSEDRYAVHTAASGTEGLKLAAEQTFHAMIVDLKLPGENGLDVIRAIRQRQPSCIAIMLTGCATIQVAQQLIREGCDDLLLKPLRDPSQLDRAILRAAERRRLLQGIESLWHLGDSQQAMWRLALATLRDSAKRYRNLVGELERLGVFAENEQLERLCGSLQYELKTVTDMVGEQCADGQEAECFHG